jgi:hypothetical protein
MLLDKYSNIELKNFNKIKDTIYYTINVHYYDFYIDWTNNDKLFKLLNGKNACFMYLNKMINHNNKFEKLLTINTKKNIINNIKKLDNTHIKIAYLLLYSDNILFNYGTPSYNIYMLNNNTNIPTLESKCFNSDIMLFTDFNDLVFQCHLYGDRWSEYTGIENGNFNFNNFFYDETAYNYNKIQSFNTLIIYSTYISSDNLIIMRGNLINKSELINKKIIF